MAIDHKDKDGAGRAATFERVQKELEFRGEGPEDGQFCLGNWTYRYNWTHAPEKSGPLAYTSFAADGSAPAKAIDGKFDNPKDRWAFNDDRSFSLWSYVEPMPQYGIVEPTYSEDRYHVLIKDKDEFVLFNGDGSIVMVFARATE